MKTMTKEKPITPNENKIILLLGLLGIKKNELSFSSLVTKTKENTKIERFFSLGHWLPIETENILYVQEHCDVHIEEISWHDDELGWQCYYAIEDIFVES